MKPLPRAPFTQEDRAIFSAKLQTGSWPFCAYLEFMGRDADRRDAELMLQLTHYDHWERDYTRDRVRSVATAFRLVWRQL